MSGVPAAEIDESGTFKYVLINCKNQDETFTIVRGYGWAEYHDDIYQDVHSKLKQAGKITHSECVGGGRIQHQPSSKQLKVYGYSQAFGRANHAKAVELLRSKYPDYDISWSNEGY